MSYQRFSITLLTTLGLILLAACGGSDGGTTDPPPGNTAPSLTGSIPNVTAVITEGSQTLSLGDFFSDAQDSDAELTYSVTNNSNNAAVYALNYQQWGSSSRARLHLPLTRITYRWGVRVG